MLSKLFGSKARVKILKLFLSNPDKSFYVRQISRDLDLQINSVRRELENLEKFGLLISGNELTLGGGNEQDEYAEQFNIKKTKTSKVESSKTEKKYFKANDEFILFEEIKALILKAQVLYEQDFVDKLKSIGNLKLLILTGFFVNNPNSEIDILIVGKINKTKFLKLIKELEGELDREVNYTLFASREFKYRRDITDVFIYSILEGRKFVVVDEIGAT